MFRTKYEEHKRVYSDPGSPVVPVYKSEYDENHNLVVKENGVKNLYAEINSHAESCDIHVVLNRFVNGDKEALMQRAGAFIDISQMPDNLNDFVKLASQAESLFNTLPYEVKEKFNNNPVEFISQIGTTSWEEKMTTSEAQEKMANDEVIKAASAINKEAAKTQYGFDNTVYGPVQPESPSPEPVPSESVKTSKKLFGGDI